MTTTNEARRRIMRGAWAAFRNRMHATFAAALRWSWEWERRCQAAASAWMARQHRSVQQFGKSPIFSPTERALAGQPYARVRSRDAGRLIGAIGR